MEKQLLGQVYFIKDGKMAVRNLTISQDNFEKQKVRKFNYFVKLYSDDELSWGHKNYADIYREYLDNGFTVVRACNKCLCDMMEMAILDSSYIDIFIPSKTSLEDAKALEAVLKQYAKEEKSAFTITNYHDGDFDFYDYIYNFSYKKREISEICNYYYKEKAGRLTLEEQEMFREYRTFDLRELFLGDFYQYPLNNNNTGVIIITPTDTIRKTVTKSKHKLEIMNILKNRYPVNDQDNYLDLVSDYNLILGFVTKDVLIAYISADRNSYQQEALEKLSDLAMEIKEVKSDLLTNYNVIKDREIVAEGDFEDLKCATVRIKK